MRSEMARFACIQILNSQAAQSINFAIGPYRITGASYLKVAAALLTGDIAVDVNPSRLKPDQGAMYLPGENEFVVRTAALTATLVQRMTVVHESTHAAIDIQGFRYDDTWSDNEAAAYVAGALYMYKTSLSSIWDGDTSIDLMTRVEPWATAFRIAASISSGNPNVPAKDAIDLRAKIKGSQPYKRLGMTFGTRLLSDGTRRR